MNEPLLEIDDLTIKYQTSNGPLTAVTDASLTIESGNYFGLVGESGCGKSTIAQALIGGLDDNGYISSGSIRYKGREIQDMSESSLNREIRWDEISYIPQGSMNSLDPLTRVSEQAIEIADVHTNLTKQESRERLEEMFSIVGLPANRATDYPHQFSGGMQQRAVIALALFLKPSLIIADEPTTALDVIMQDQIFKYLDEIRSEIETSVLLITHDISLIFESVDNMAIMHSGQIAEEGSVTALFDEPRHPYSILLQEAFPDIRHPDRDLKVIENNPPQTFGEVDFCTFVDRCPWAVEECHQHPPPLESVEDSSTADGPPQKAACFRKDEVLDQYRMNADELSTNQSTNSDQS